LEFQALTEGKSLYTAPHWTLMTSLNKFREEAALNILRHDI
jgi:hypothetical protein